MLGFVTGSIERMGTTTSSVGVNAIRGLYKVSRAYANSFNKATKSAYNGLSDVGRTYKRGFSRVGNNLAGLANAYSRYDFLVINLHHYFNHCVSLSLRMSVMLCLTFFTLQHFHLVISSRCLISAVSYYIYEI